MTVFYKDKSFWNIMLPIALAAFVLSATGYAFGYIKHNQIKDSVQQVKAAHPHLTEKDNQLLNAYVECKDAGQPLRESHSLYFSNSIQTSEQRCAENAVLNLYPDPKTREDPETKLSQWLHIPRPFSGINN
jgi:hypothetical protein